MRAMLSDFAIVRRGRPADAEALDRIFRASWTNAYRGILPEASLRKLVDRRGHAWWRAAAAGADAGLLVAEAAGELAGYATFGRARTALPFRGEIYELYLSPLHQGLGIGVQLFESARQKLDERGLDGLIVWALTENTGACDFYRRRGGAELGSSSERFGGRDVAKTLFGWR
jgi:GNAT superfamily N-acetyltransferase